MGTPWMNPADSGWSVFDPLRPFARGGTLAGSVSKSSEAWKNYGLGRSMGRRNYLIEGVSCSGKTTICNELRERGYHVINGDTELAYQGDPATGEPLKGHAHEHHIWNVSKVKALAADQSHGATFFCGGSRNFHRFIDVFDLVFVLEVDLHTLNRRLAARPKGEWGSKPAEQRLIRRLHTTREDLPRDAVPIDATAPVDDVVNSVLKECS